MNYTGLEYMPISLLNWIYKYKLILPNYEINPNLDQPKQKARNRTNRTNIKAIAKWLKP